MKIIPRKGQICVKPEDEPSRQTANGLVLPNNEEQETRAVGVVQSVGEGITDLKKGDKVLYGAFAGELLKMNEDGKEVDYRILFDEDVLATLVK